MQPSEQHIPHSLYRIAKFLVSIWLGITFRWKIIGAEEVPQTGPVVFGSNHISNVDPILIGASTFRPVRFMAKEELFKNRIVGAFLRYLGAFQVKRGLKDTAAIRFAIDIPNSGQCLVVFPEGHRSRTGQLGEGMAGIALIARKANAPIVPVAIIGPYKFRGRLTIRFGQTLYPTIDDTNETLLQRIMSAIHDLVKEGHGR